MRNEAGISRYSLRLGGRIGAVLEAGDFPLVLGGDCSILLGAMLALRRRGRYGLAFIDGHTDFRHPGNAPSVGAAAGEDLALVTGRGGNLADLEGLRPLVAERDVVAIGAREHDAELSEVRDSGIDVLTARWVRDAEAASAAAGTVEILEARGVEGF